jgi:signal peptidase I
MENKPRKWWLAAILTLCSPGLGHIYNGQGRTGIIILVLSNYIMPFLLLPCITRYLNTLSLPFLYAVVAVAMLLYLVVIADAIRVAHRLKFEYQPRKYNKWYVYVGIIAVITVVSLAVPSLNFDGDRIRSNYMQAYKIPSGSMEPTLLVGDRILVDRRVSARTPTRGTIIIFEYPEDPTKDFVKRVEAVGGDTVEVRNKELYVNKKLVTEAYVAHLETNIIPAGENPRDNFGPVTVPKDACFVMGDNRDRAYDSRFWGFVDKPRIKGTVGQIYWSWDRKASAVRWGRIGKKFQTGS